MAAKKAAKKATTKKAATKKAATKTSTTKTVEDPDKNTDPSPPQEVTEEGHILPVEVPDGPPEEPETFDEDSSTVEPDFEAEEVDKTGDDS